jgi:hypothetical protein
MGSSGPENNAAPGAALRVSRRQEAALTLGLGSPPPITGLGGCCARSAGGGVNGEVDRCRMLLQGIYGE